MSIFTKAVAAVKKVANKVVSTAKNAVNSFANRSVSVTPNSNWMSSINFTPQQSIQSKTTTSIPAKTTTKSIPNETLPSYVNTPVYQKSIGGGSSNLYSGTSNVDNTFFAPTNTRTLTSSTFGTGTGGAGSIGLGGNTSPVSLPNTPTNRDVGLVGLQGLATDNTKINPDTGLFDTQGTLNQEENNDLTKAIRDLKDIPEKENVFDNEMIQKQNEEVRNKQQEVNNWQGQLNSIVAKQQQDLMRHEKEISLAGGTVEGFSGRAAAINREAAYAALPVQAQLATAQGNLELAQSYLKDLTMMVREEIDNNYTYKVAQYNAVKDIADKREKTELDRLEKEETRAYNQRNDNLGLIDSWMQEAVSTQQPNLVGRLSKLNIDDPNFREKLAAVIGQIQEPVKNTPPAAQQKTLINSTLKTGIAPSGEKIGNPRGADGFVDPYVYIEAFNNWEGSAKDFLIAFPIKTNVNPASYNKLPEALKATLPKASSTSSSEMSDEEFLKLLNQ